MVLPKPIYEFLPLLYLTSGILVSHAIESNLADFSAFVLGFVAVFVVLLRVDHRKHRSARLRGQKYSRMIEARHRTEGQSRY